MVKPDFILSFAQNLNCEISPVCAILGGVVAQEILKIICHNDQPFSNFLFFNGDDDSALVENLRTVQEPPSTVKAKTSEVVLI